MGLDQRPSNMDDWLTKYADVSFTEFMTAERFSERLQGFIVHALAFIDTSQPMVTTSEAVARVHTFVASIGRFTKQGEALLYCNYGQGEFPQSFCRIASVYNAIYILSWAPQALVTVDGACTGIVTMDGQYIQGDHIVTSMDFLP